MNLSEAKNKEISDSWVFVEGQKSSTSEDAVDTKEIETYGVEEVDKIETDSDSISVISEGSCYSDNNTDNEESNSSSIPNTYKEAIEQNSQENSVKTINAPLIQTLPFITQDEYNQKLEKYMYLAMSALCTIIIIGLSVAVQYYSQGSHDISEALQNDESSMDYCVQPHTKSEFVESQNNILKEEVKKRYSQRTKDQNKKDNTETSNQAGTMTDDSQLYRKVYEEKLEQLKIMEDYLNQKEKYLLNKEHYLLKKELHFDKDKEYLKENKKNRKNKKKRQF